MVNQNQVPLIEDPEKALANFIYDYLLKKNHVSAAAAFIVEAQIATQEVNTNTDPNLIFLQDWFDPFWMIYVESRKSVEKRDARIREFLEIAEKTQPSIEKARRMKLEDYDETAKNNGQNSINVPNEEIDGKVKQEDTNFVAPSNPPPASTPKNGVAKTPRVAQDVSTPANNNNNNNNNNSNNGTPARPQNISIPPNNFPIEEWPGTNPNNPAATVPQNIQQQQQVQQPNMNQGQMVPTNPNMANQQMMQATQGNPNMLMNMSRPNQQMMASNPALMRNLQGQMQAFQQQQFMAHQTLQNQIRLQNNPQFLMQQRMMRPYAQMNQNMRPGNMNNIQMQQAAFVEQQKQAQAMKAQNSQNTPNQGPNSASAGMDPQQLANLQQMQSMGNLPNQNMMPAGNNMQGNLMNFNNNNNKQPNGVNNELRTPEVDTSVNFEKMFSELNAPTPTSGMNNNMAAQLASQGGADKKISPTMANANADNKAGDKISFESYINDGDYSFNFDTALNGLDNHTQSPKTSTVNVNVTEGHELTGSLESIMGMDPFGHSEYFS